MGVHWLPDSAQAGGYSDHRRSTAALTKGPTRSAGRVYAICFDLDTALLERHHPCGKRNAGYDEISRALRACGFGRKQGSVYFGGPDTSAVDCVLAVQEISKRYRWFKFAVRDIRMLRVDEDNDLMPAVGCQTDLLDDAGGM